MRRVLRFLVGVSVVVALFGAASNARPTTANAQAAKTCSAGFVRAVVAGQVKCLHAGEFCAGRYDATYRRYGFSCRVGRLMAVAKPPSKFMSSDDNIVCFFGGKPKMMLCGTQDTAIEVQLWTHPWRRPTAYKTSHLAFRAA